MFEKGNKKRSWRYTFRINTAMIAVDDLVEDELARIGTLIVADRPSPDEHLFIVTSKDASVTPESILRVLNERFSLNAEFVENAGDQE